MAKKLYIEVELQFYGESEEEQDDILKEIRDTLVSVANLPAIAVGTFVKSDIREADKVCGQPLYENGVHIGNCTKVWGTEHDHG